MYGIIQNKDFKSENINSVLEHPMRLEQLTNNQIFDPLMIIWFLIISREKPSFFMFRYLNDYPSIIKTVIKAISEWLTVHICKLLAIKIVWLCHNIDRESIVYHKKINEARRQMIYRNSQKVFVTDVYLISHFEEVFGSKEKVEALSFGNPYLGNKKINRNHQMQIMDFIQAVRTNDNQACIGLSIGSPNDKVIHFYYTKALIDHAHKVNKNVYIIIAGPVGDYIKRKDEETYNFLKTHKQVLFIDEKVRVDEEEIANQVDFYWRSYADFSIPFGIYYAVYQNTPILTMPYGLLGELVIGEGIGYCLTDNFSDIEQALNLVKANQFQYENFKMTRQWSYAATKIKELF